MADDGQILIKPDGSEIPPPAADDSQLPKLLPVLPLNDMVIFPGMVVPLVIKDGGSRQMVHDVLNGSRHFVSLLSREQDMTAEARQSAKLHRFGCLCRLIRMMKMPDDSIRVLIQGVSRAAVKQCEDRRHYPVCAINIEKDRQEESVELSALINNARRQLQLIVSLSSNLPDELNVAALNTDDPGRLADLIAANLNLQPGERQQLLEELSPTARLKKLTELMTREREVLQLGSKIQDSVNEKVSGTQREYYLRQQLEAIRRELGEEDEQAEVVRELEEKINRSGMPAQVREVAERQLQRLQSISPSSPEYSVTRTYLDWLVDMPWSRSSDDVLDLQQARKVLDEDHYDLQQIKERILEYLAVRKLKQDMKGPILCFAGPPGVGKTSLGKSIARAMGREFIRMSLGGVRDEAEIRGHRRTYIGALPGRIIQGIKKVNTRNPVFMLDEIDKLGSDFRGDPSSALLEVLDPEQNDSFSDHYLEVPFDLSAVLFITTANRLDTIPPPLRDRMEIVELSGYTVNEKVNIARRFLVKKQIREHGLKTKHLRFPKRILEQVIGDYTREAGVRGLEREIAACCRKAARRVAEGDEGPFRVDRERVQEWLGPARYKRDETERAAIPGVAVGLAWTPSGGEILYVEATRMPGSGQLILTGSMGEVMKESARAALSCVRAGAGRWQLDVSELEKQDIHIHVPAGAIPKDGPSAGAAMALALISLLRDRPVARRLGLSGEITLRGRVLPVGGVKEKVLAASRAGVRRIILPRPNEKDLQQVPEDISEKLELNFVDKIDEIVQVAFTSAGRHNARG